MTDNIEKENSVNEEIEIEEEGKKLSKRQVRKYEKEIEELNIQISEWQQKYALALNTAAHHENLMKHYKSEYESFAKYRSQAMIEKIIPALDSFQMAFSLPATTKETENYRIGFEFILKQIKDALENEGAYEIAPQVGQKFDHNLHSAVESVETEDEKLVDTIHSVRLNGYKLKDRLIRPATVLVYVKKVVKEESLEEKTNDEIINEEVINETINEEIIEENNQLDEQNESIDINIEENDEQIIEEELEK